MIILCAECGNEKSIPDKEYRRQRKAGRTEFFCCRSCAVAHSNRVHTVVTKICPGCGRPFESSTHPRAAEFCCRGCASKGSVTAHRRLRASETGKQNQGSLIPVRDTLRHREAWKYTEVSEWLVAQGLSHEFEYRLAGGLYVYDLALLLQSCLIEFDGSYHRRKAQRVLDQERDAFALSQGWQVIRVPTQTNSVIPRDALQAISFRYPTALVL